MVALSNTSARYDCRGKNSNDRTQLSCGGDPRDDNLRFNFSARLQQ